MVDSTHFFEKFQPTHYDIYLDIDRSAKHFAGVTTIKGNASAAEIALHQKFLNVTSVQADGQAVPFSFSDRQEAINIKLPHPGNVELKVAYDAKLTDTMMGIYPSYYMLDGQKHQLIGTQFETTAARQAFPGIDEPEAKATFSLAIKYDEHPGETIIANMPEDHVENGVHYFKETVKMSTYLVAFAFGGEAQPHDYARALADGGLLALVATLGLAQGAHEAAPALAPAQMAAAAATPTMRTAHFFPFPVFFFFSGFFSGALGAAP